MATWSMINVQYLHKNPCDLKLSTIRCLHTVIKLSHTHMHMPVFFISFAIISFAENKLELVLTGLIKKCLIKVRQQQIFIFKCSLKITQRFN